MNFPAWLSKRLALAKQAGFDLDVSLCGCALPEGAFGSHGWHSYRATQATLYSRARALFARERLGTHPHLIATEWRDWLVAEEAAGRFDPRTGMHETWRPYLGALFAYERCPAYMAGYTRNLEQETARKARTAGGRQKLLGED